MIEQRKDTTSASETAAAKVSIKISESAVRGMTRLTWLMKACMIRRVNCHDD